MLAPGFVAVVKCLGYDTPHLLIAGGEHGLPKTMSQFNKKYSHGKFEYMGQYQMMGEKKTVTKVNIR